MDRGCLRCAKLSVRGGCQLHCRTSNCEEQDSAVAAIPEERGKGKETRHSCWTTPSIDCNGMHAGELRLLAITASLGHPLPPFVIGKDGSSHQDDDRDNCNNLQHNLSIARLAAETSLVLYPYRCGPFILLEIPLAHRSFKYRHPWRHQP